MLMPTLESLPQDILREIMAYLDLGATKSLYSTSTFFKQLTSSSYLGLKALYQQLSQHKIIKADSYAGNVYFLRADGKVLVSGDLNRYDRYKNNFNISNRILGIKLIPNLDKVTDITVGYDQAFFVKSDGTLLAMGCNFDKRLGLPPVDSNTYDIPTPIPGIDHVKKVYIGGSNTVILHDDNSISIFGGTDRFQIPTTNDVDPSGHIQHHIRLPYKIIDAAVGANHIILVDETNQAHIYGDFYENPPSLNPTEERLVPGLNDIQGVSSNRDHSLFIKKTGEVMGLGSKAHGNALGEFGLGHNNIPSSLVAIPTLTNIKQVLARQDYSIAITHEGDVFTTGQNACGVLGLGDRHNRNQFTPIPNLHDIEKVNAHFIGVIATDKKGRMYGWGANNNDELGLGHTNNILAPQSISIVNRYYELMEKLESICSPHRLSDDIKQYCKSQSL